MSMHNAILSAVKTSKTISIDYESIAFPMSLSSNFLYDAIVHV